MTELDPLLDTVLEKTSQQQQTPGKPSGREEGGCGQYISANEELLRYMLDDPLRPVVSWVTLVDILDDH